MESGVVVKQGAIRRVGKNTLLLTISEGGGRTLIFLFYIIAARNLGVKEFGILSFALALTTMFGVLADLGLNVFLTREVARDYKEINNIFPNAAAIRSAGAIIVIGLSCLVVKILGYPPLTLKVVYILSVSIIFSVLNLLFYAIFQGYEQMEYISIGKGLGCIVLVVGAWILSYLKVGVMGFAVLYCAAAVISFFFNISIVKIKFVALSLKVDFRYWKSMLKDSIPIGLALIFIAIYNWISSGMLSLMKGEEAVGWYNASYRLAIGLTYFAGAFVSAIYPLLSRAHVDSKEKVLFIFEKSLKYLLILGLPLSIGTTLLADKITLLLYGNSYIPSILALKILVWIVVLTFINIAFGNLVTATNHQNILTRQTGYCLILNILLNLILIPKFSFIGASIATVITEIFALGYYLFAIPKTGYWLGKNTYFAIFKKLFLPAGTVTIFILLFRNFNLFLIVTVSVFLYLIVLYFNKSFDKNDFNIIKSLLRIKKYD